MFRRFAPLCAKSLARRPHPAATLHPRIARPNQAERATKPCLPARIADSTAVERSVRVGVHEPVVQTHTSPIARALVPYCPEGRDVNGCPMLACCSNPTPQAVGIRHRAIATGLTVLECDQLSVIEISAVKNRQVSREMAPTARGTPPGGLNAGGLCRGKTQSQTLRRARG